MALKAKIKQVFPEALWDKIRSTLYLFQEFQRDVRSYFSPQHPIQSIRLFRFARTIRKGQAGYTMVKRENLRRLYFAALNLKSDSIGGAVLECGSWNGGAAATVAYALQDDVRDFFVFDSFQGLPPPTPEDGERAHVLYREGWCKGEPEKVREVFHMISFPEQKLHIHEGWFHDTFPGVTVGGIALLHIDADWYESVKLCLETFYDKVVSGGYIFFDDYSSWEGCRTAVDEFFSKRGITLELVDGHYIRKQ